MVDADEWIELWLIPFINNILIIDDLSNIALPLILYINVIDARLIQKQPSNSVFLQLLPNVT